MPLKIIIVGAGLAGCAAAIGFAHQGHHVQVYERRTPSLGEESGGGIQLQPNLGRILREWDMLNDLKKVGHDNVQCALRTFNEGRVGLLDFRPKGNAWYGLRRVWRDFFRLHAVQAGAQVFEGTGVVSVDAEGPTVTLQDGTIVECDLIIGADGSGSRVRKTLFPDYKPERLQQACFEIRLPLDEVRNDPLLKTLLDEPYNSLTVSPGRAIFASPLPFQNIFNMQFFDHSYNFEQDPQPDKTTERISDLTWLRQRFGDYDEAVKKALATVDSAFKWRFVEVSGLPSWSSSNGKIILIGDSVHCMTPYCGQGSATGAEDAAALSVLLEHASPGIDLASVAKMYEKIRRPRCEKLQWLSQVHGNIWMVEKEDDIEARNKAWKTINKPEYHFAIPDMDAPFDSQEFIRWLDKYDVFEAARNEQIKAGVRPTEKFKRPPVMRGVTTN